MKNLTQKLAFCLVLLIAYTGVKAQNNTENQLFFNKQNPFGQCDSIVNKAWVNNQWHNGVAYGFDMDANNYIMKWRWWDTSGALTNAFYYTRDANNNTTELEMWSNLFGPFEYTGKITATYNSAKKITEELSQFNYPNVGLINSERITYSYDSEDKMTQRLIEKYKMSSSTWETSGKEVFTYDANNRLTEAISSKYDGTNWTDDERVTYTYNSNGQIETETVEENSSSTTSWELEEKETYTYNTNGQKWISLTQNYENSAWVNSELDSVFYAGANTSSKHYVWSNGAWKIERLEECANGGSNPTAPNPPSNLSVNPKKKKDDAKMLLTWDDNSDNELGFIIYSSTDGTNWTTIDSTAANVETYTDSLLSYATTYHYRVAAYNNVGNSAFSNSVSNTTYTAIQYFGSNLSLNAYPNPVKNTLHINYNSTANQLVNVTITNLAGQVLYSEAITLNAGNSVKNIDIRHLKSGIYSLNIRGEKVNYVQLLSVE